MSDAMRVTASLSAVLVFAGLTGSARPVSAQSLSDVSRQEEERRKDVKAPAKVYTNKDLGTPPVANAEPGDSSKPAGGTRSAVPATPPAPAAADKAKDAVKDGAKDQKYWSTRKKELDSKLERDKVLADALQSRINGLTTDFAARSDPAQRSVIEKDRQRAVSELDATRKGITDGQKALSDLDEEARKAGVPPGWLR